MSLEYKHGLIEREEAERRAIEAYRMGTISDSELIREYPKYKGIIQVKDEKFERLLKRQEAMMDNFRNEINGTIQRRLEDSGNRTNNTSESSWTNKLLIEGLQLLVSHQSALLEIPFFNLLPAGYVATKCIPIDAFAKKFKLSKTVKLALRFSLILAVTNYLYAFQSAIQVSKESIPNLIVIAKSLSTNVFNIISKGGIMQYNNIKGLSIYEKAIITGKLLKEFEKLSIAAIGNALALALVQNSITNEETDVNGIIDSVDDDSGIGSYVKGAFNSIIGKVKEPKNIEDQVFKSPTSLYTNEQLKRINDGMMSIEPIMEELAIIEETKIYNPSSWNKAIGAIKRIPKTLDDIKDQKLGTQVEESVRSVLFKLNPEIAKHVNMDSLSITAKAINNEIETTCDLLESEGRYSLYRGAEAYNFQTSLGGFLPLPGIKVGEVRPVNVLQKTQEINVDIVLGGLSLIYIFTLLYYAHSGFKKVYKYWKPSRDENNIEVLPDQRIRRRKSKSTRSKRKY
jgi:hypothetical protein